MLCASPPFITLQATIALLLFFNLLHVHLLDHSGNAGPFLIHSIVGDLVSGTLLTNSDSAALLPAVFGVGLPRFPRGKPGRREAQVL